MRMVKKMKKATEEKWKSAWNEHIFDVLNCDNIHHMQDLKPLLFDLYDVCFLSPPPSLSSGSFIPCRTSHAPHTKATSKIYIMSWCYMVNYIYYFFYWIRWHVIFSVFESWLFSIWIQWTDIHPTHKHVLAIFCVHWIFHEITSNVYLGLLCVYVLFTLSVSACIWS